MPSASTRRATALPAFFLALGLTGCAPEQPAAAPTPAQPVSFARAYVSALEAEAKDPVSAGPYLDLVDAAVAGADAPGALPAALGALDVLVTGNVPGFDGMGPSALAYRSRELLPQVVSRLRRAWEAASPRPSASSPVLPFLRGQIAGALHALALYTGDQGAASFYGARRGCAPAATLVGPFDWTPLRGLEMSLPIGPDAPMAASYAGVAPFAAQVTPAVVHADQCLLETSSTSLLQGTRALVVDVSVPRAQTIHLALSSSSAAVVEAGGVRVLERSFSGGGRGLTRLGSVDVGAGTVRVVVKVAQRGDGNQIELDLWGEDGLPLVTHAPRTGDRAEARAGKARPLVITPSGPGSDEAIVAAAGLLALGAARAAEHLLEPQGTTGDKARPAALELLYARAVELADDLPDAKMNERIRGAIDRVVAGWPTAWEGRIGHARITERRRGAGEGVTEALRELGAGKAHEGAAAPPRDRMITAYIASVAKRAQLLDLAEQAYAELAHEAPGAPMLAFLDARLHARGGDEAVRAACKGGLSRADTDCFEQLRERGDYPGALAEIDRLRKLRDAPEGLRELEISTRILSGDLPGALAVYDALRPAERRMLDTLGFAAGRGDVKAVKQRFVRDRLAARDAPYALDPLIRLLGLEPDPSPALEAEGLKLVAADRAQAFLPGAGTAVLRRDERYRIDETGLVHFYIYDLRRISGTTDVASGGVSYGPMIEGRGAPRLLRRRIHKRDGRILEPDAAANAAQQSDLSQLEQGDYVEQISEGWALPGDTGQILLDTPDLLPERTSVRQATVELRRASSLPLALWSHPLLGKASEVREGDTTISTWQLRDAAPRRIEDGVPKMERSCSISAGTQTWAQVARALEENARSYDERDPYVTRWLDEVVGGERAVSRALIDKVVAAVGKKVKVAGGGELSDVAAVFGGGPQRSTARSILELGQGTRSWVIYRALRELGVKVDLAVAETEPFSASADFPPHVGRFRHPLVIAHLGGDDGDVWIDADVEGPPLPPGKVSPELRGRSALFESGAMVAVQGSSGDTGDEIDLRLTLDDKGDAAGTFTVLLHGRTAQSLAEAFETVVGSERREMLRGVVLGWIPWADVDDVTVSSSEGSWEVALRAKIAIHGYGRPEGKDGKTWVLAGLEPVHMVFPRGTVGTLGATYASRGARQNALSIDAPIQYHFRRRIELPAKAAVLRLPDGVKVEGPHLQASRRIVTTANILEDDFRLSLPTGTISAEGYTGFVAKVQAVDDGFMASTRIKVK
jgi:hypothetical protein